MNVSHIASVLKRQSIDNQILDGIRDLQSMEDPEILATLIRMFLESLPKRLASIRSAVFDSDPTLLREEAHSLKSSSASLGAAKMADICEGLEELGKDKDLKSSRPLFEELENEMLKVVSELQALPELNQKKTK
jgi:HPt (histidine-containing phosphotransfer) domain-containing protein